MSTVNVTAREIAAKIVFYGPGLSGKTTNLRRIYESVKPTARGEMVALATEGDRTLFFDFLPVKVERIRDFTLRLGLYTVPGQVFYNATRKLVLQGADGVVFVADSQAEALERNVESLENLVDNLRDEGIDVTEFPLVLQWNKRDLRNTLPLDRLHQALNRWTAPEFEASATEGRGVMETLKAITRLVIKDLRLKGVVGGEPSRPSSGEQAIAPGEPASGINAALESQIAQQELPLEPLPVPELPPTPLEPPQSVEPPAWETSNGATAPAMPELEGGSFLLSLAPAVFRAEVAAVEVSFAAGEYDACVKSALTLIRALGGQTDVVASSYLLGLDGREVRALTEAVAREPTRRDGARALALVAQACLHSG